MNPEEEKLALIITDDPNDLIDVYSVSTSTHPTEFGGVELICNVHIDQSQDKEAGIAQAEAKAIAFIDGLNGIWRLCLSKFSSDFLKKPYLGIFLKRQLGEVANLETDKEMKIIEKVAKNLRSLDRHTAREIELSGSVRYAVRMLNRCLLD